MQVEDILRSPQHSFPAEYLDLLLLIAAVSKLFGFRGQLELSQAGVGSLDRGDGVSLRLPAGPQLHLALGGGASVGVERGSKDAVLHSGHQSPGLGNQTDADWLI